MAAPVAYGSSWARDGICATAAAMPDPYKKLPWCLLLLTAVFFFPLWCGFINFVF